MARHHQQVGVLRWSLNTTDESQMPLTINCWPEAEGGGQMNVSMEYELVGNSRHCCRFGGVLHWSIISRSVGLLLVVVVDAPFLSPARPTGEYQENDFQKESEKTAVLHFEERKK